MQDKIIDRVIRTSGIEDNDKIRAMLTKMDVRCLQKYLVHTHPEMPARKLVIFTGLPRQTAHRFKSQILG